jgi:hypothetical protein
MSNNRHHCAPHQVCNCIPTDEELYHLGFEKWQVSMMRKLPVDLQWEAHDEFIRRLMSDDDTDTFRF